MDTKKWPILAQIIIGLGIIGSLQAILGGLLKSDIFMLILGITGVIVFWGIYKFKSWALIGLNIILSLRILLGLADIYRGLPLVVGIITIAIPVLIIVYFNSSQIKKLFPEK